MVARPWPGRSRRQRWKILEADDAGSLPFAMLLAHVAMSLCSVSACGDRPSRRHPGGDAAGPVLHADRVGLDVALSRIGAAQNAGMGQVAKLPCAPFDLQ